MDSGAGEQVVSDAPRYNPRYLAYCAAHGRTVEEMRAHDEIQWPGGRACGFMLWIGAAWQTWDAFACCGRRHDRDHARGPKEHARFDAWLPTCGITLDVDGRANKPTRKNQTVP